MHTVLWWIVQHPDRVLALIAIVISALAMLDVRSLFKELERRDRNTQEQVRQTILRELLMHTGSFATLYRAAQFIDFNPGQPDKQTAIAMLMSFRIQQILNPNLTPQEANQLRKGTRDQIEQGAKEWAELMISSGIGKLKDGWVFS